MEEETIKDQGDGGGDNTAMDSSSFSLYRPHRPHSRHHQHDLASAFAAPLPAQAPPAACTVSESPSSKRGKYVAANWTQIQPAAAAALDPSTSASASSSPSAPPSLAIPQHGDQYIASAASHSLLHSTSAPELQETAGTPSSASAGAALGPHSAPLRKGKFVSPVWKPPEMLALARAWRIQYSTDQSKHDPAYVKQYTSGVDAGHLSHKVKTRADKDWEVAEYLKQCGVQRDAKTAATKWDNMLGDFRRVYEWEKSSDQMPKESIAPGKLTSYFRLTPQERKMYHLPVCFDEEVYKEMVQFAGHKSQLHSQRGGGPHITAPAALAGGSGTSGQGLKESPMKDREDLTSQAIVQYQPSSVAKVEPAAALISGRDHMSVIKMSAPPRRIGKIKMVWEENVHVWGEDQGGKQRHGRIKLDSLNFLHADELVFLDDNFAGNAIEAFEHGPLEGFSSDVFTCGQQLKVFGHRKHGSSSQPFLPVAPASFTLRDKTSYFLGCLKTPPTGLPSLSELISHFKEPPPQDWRFPLRSDVYMDLPTGKEAFFVVSSEEVDCREIIYEIVAPLIRSSSNLGSSREFLMGLWDDCINRVVRYFCTDELELIRNSFADTSEGDERASVCGLIRNLCLWRGEEKGLLATPSDNPSVRLVSKLLWTYGELPYILGYYAMGSNATFCALSRDEDKVMCTNLATISLLNPAERLRALTPCWHVAQLLPVLADLCSKLNRKIHSDYERIHRADGKVVEVMFSHVKKSFPNRRRWAIVKEIYEVLREHQVPFVEYMYKAEEHELALLFRPRGHPIRPTTTDQLVAALKCVCTALIALHNLSLMHRDVRWENVMKRSYSDGGGAAGEEEEGDDEWFLIDFDESVEAPQMYPHSGATPASHAPEMSRGCHGLKADVWGVGHLIKSSGLYLLDPLRDLQRRCMEPDPDLRPPLADCFFHLVQLHSSLKHLY